VASGKSPSPSRFATPCVPAVCSWCKAAITSRSGTWSMMTGNGSRPANRLTDASICQPMGGCFWPSSPPNSSGPCAPRNGDCPAIASRRSKMAGSNSGNATPWRSHARYASCAATISASLPRVRIEDLLQDVDEWCRFTRAFQPLGGYLPRGADLHRSLLATVIAHGTNLGLAAMSQSVDTLTAEILQDTSRWFLRDATIKAANTILVNHHHGLELSGIWGDGSRSSSDGQRFAVERRSLLGSVYPRYFGYYDRALQLYTHTSDQHSVYGTQAISCTPREAGYVLGGVLDNDTELAIREHTSDTNGFTEHLFGLCALLGITFMPRLKDLPDQVLSRI